MADQTTIRVEKELLSKFKKEAISILGQDMFISTQAALNIVLADYLKLKGK